jgi:type I restriction enzyme S subunit
MKWARLGDVATIVSGSTPDTSNKSYWTGDIPWVTPADLAKNDGVFYEGNPRKITKAGYDSCSTAMIPAGSILFSSRAPIGHCAIAAYPLCTNQGFKNVVPGEMLDSLYGYYALRRFTDDIASMGHGATFDEVTKEMMENFQIPLPSLDEQRRVAAVLRAADGERRRRRYTQSLSDALLREIFVQMFGDLITNERGWEVEPLGTYITDMRNGLSPSTGGVVQGKVVTTQPGPEKPFSGILST